MCHTTGFEPQSELADLPVCLVAGDPIRTESARRVRVRSLFAPVRVSSRTRPCHRSRRCGTGRGPRSTPSADTTPDRSTPDRGRTRRQGTPRFDCSRSVQRYRSTAGPPQPSGFPSSKTLSRQRSTHRCRRHRSFRRRPRARRHAARRSPRSRNSAVVACPPGHCRRLPLPVSTRSYVQLHRAVRARTRPSGAPTPPAETAPRIANRTRRTPPTTPTPLTAYQVNYHNRTIGNKLSLQY